MKKIFILLSFITLFNITGCSNDKLKIDYMDDPRYDKMPATSYKFVGQSEHLYFKTGKVYYNNDERGLLLSNFGVKDNVNKNDSFSINLYFNDRLLYGQIDEGNKGASNKETVKDIVVSELGKVGEKDEQGNYIGESDSFLETTKETFKDSIKLTARYCIQNNCQIEEFTITYIK